MITTKEAAVLFSKNYEGSGSYDAWSDHAWQAVIDAVTQDEQERCLACVADAADRYGGHNTAAGATELIKTKWRPTTRQQQVPQNSPAQSQSKVERDLNELPSSMPAIRSLVYWGSTQSYAIVPGELLRAAILELTRAFLKAN